MRTCPGCGEPIRAPRWDHEDWECWYCGTYYGATPPQPVPEVLEQQVPDEDYPRYE